MPTFTISVNNKVLGTYVVKKTVITIGRSRTNTISIASKAVSRNHVRIELARDGWSISDLGSLNGTYINDIRVTSAFISEGDKVTVGAYTISFSPEPAQESSQEESPVVQASGGEPLSDTDVRVEGAASPPATDTAITPPKEQTPPVETARPPEQPKAQEVIEEISAAGQSHPAFSDTKNIEVGAQQAAPSADQVGDAQKKKRSELLRSNPAGLQLEDRIRLAIFENPLADDTTIRKRLSDSDFGGASIGRSELQTTLKKMGLETKVKRYQYFMHS
ncbi:MAG TPA: FHA domain-containing protein [Chitinivibrionales bacterium]|nr:FHA domain-containing protein [Chitinivibrionales bacterium]